MILESENTYGGVSVSLCGKNQKELTTVKKILKDLLKVCRFLYLEISMVFLNNQLVSSMKPSKTLEVFSYGNFSYFMDQYMNIEDFLKTD